MNHVEGSEISKIDAKGWWPPKLTCQVLAALQQRIACGSNSLQRGALLLDLALWLGTRKQHTVQDLFAESFGLNAQHAARPFQNIFPLSDLRTLKAAGADAQETPMELLQESFVEDSPHMLSLGTKDALTLGLHRFGMMHRALQKEDPAVPLSKVSATLYAVSDPFGDLKPRECHAVMHGRILRGPLVVWSCPSQLPWDFELWEAVPIPSSRPAPSNCIVVSRAGLAVTRLAGGDFDGDLCCVSSDDNFIALGHRCVVGGTGRAWFSNTY